MDRSSYTAAVQSRSPRDKTAYVTIVPISALRGENVLRRSIDMNWYAGQTLVEELEAAPVGARDETLFRMPVQYIVRAGVDFRGVAGLIVGGSVGIGDEVAVYPSRRLSRVSRVIAFGRPVQRAHVGQSVVICLADEIDGSRGDVLAGEGPAPVIADQFVAKLVWMDDEPLYAGRSYVIRLGNQTMNGCVTEITGVVDLGTLSERRASEMRCNDVGTVKIALDRMAAFDTYEDNRDTGGFVLIDRL